MYLKYPFLKSKKVILYAPTFRGDAIYDKKSLQVDLKKITENLGEDYVVLYKMHPIISEENVGSHSNLYNMNNVNIYKLFSVCDVLVSDFSSIIMDFTILEKPILLYTPDLEEYERERGLYFDYKKFAPGTIVYDEEQLVNEIKNENYNLEKIKKIKEEFYDYKDDLSANRIAEFISTIVDVKEWGRVYMKRVMTYGTFDLLHYGHINILKRAKSLGDYLIVGLSSDEFNELKGKKSVMSYEERKEILESIRYVDKVIKESNWEQKVDDIIKYNIDVFVIGDDWEGKFDFLKEYCEVVYLPRTKSISTTLLKEIIQKEQSA